MATADSLPPEVRNLLDANLRPGEIVLWAAQPNLARAWAAPSARINRIMVRVIIWIIGFTTFMSLGGGPIIFGEFLLLAAPAIWFLSLIAPRKRAALLASASVVTNQRAMNLCATRRPKVESFEPGELNRRTTCREEADGTGSIIFFTTRRAVRHGTDTNETIVTTEHGFLYIPEVRRAEFHLGALAPPGLPA